MKNIKFIPALALIVLLSACNGSRQPTVKKPKFAKLGDEVQFEVFRDGLGSEDIYGVFGEEKLPSYVFKFNSSEKQEMKVKDGEKVISSQDDKIQYLYDVKYDSKNLRAVMKEDVISVSKASSDAGEKGYSIMDMTIDLGYQISKIDDKDYIVIYENSSKSYEPTKDVSEMNAEQREEEFYNFAGGVLGSFMSDYFSDVLNYYESYDDETKSNYKFYKNGDVYTVKYSSTNEEEFESSGVKAYKVTTVYEDCVQFEKTKNGLKFKSSEVRERTVEMLDDPYYNGVRYKKGQILTENDYEYQDNSLVAKDVTVKEVDISKYSQGMLMI